MKLRAAFTLVELVVIILILGILTAIAAPRLLDISAQATDNGLRHTLSVVRDALDLWNAENGHYPVTATEYQDFIDTRLQGRVFPDCLVGKGVPNGVHVVSAGTPLAGTGGTGGVGLPMWKYDTTTGEIIINYHATSHSGEFYDEW